MLREAAFSQGSGAIPCRRRCEGDRQSRAKEVEWEGGRVSVVGGSGRCCD